MSEADTSQDLPNIAPVVDAELCVHGLSPIATCQYCATACPLDAFALEDDGLTLDLALCDGCGLCAAACPEQAISVAGVAEPLLHPPIGAERAYMACDRVSATSERGHVTCVHAVSAARLARLYRNGIHWLEVVHADCAACDRACADTVQACVEGLNRLLADRGLPPMTIRRLSIADWRQQRDEAAGMSRRSLFRAAFQGGKHGPVELPQDPSPANTTIAPDAVLPASGQANIASHTPTIDTNMCTACGACVGVCPHGVITLAGKDNDNPRYEIAATNCTGCGLCIDSCEPGALTLQKCGPARPPPIRLVQGQCRVCSSPFYVMQETESDTRLCRICANKTHRQKLFQVLP